MEYPSYTHNIVFIYYYYYYCWQESSLSQKSDIMMKVDVAEEEPAICKNEGKKACCSTGTHNFSSGRPIFGGSGKLGNYRHKCSETTA